jgi:fatty-acyl-CoA synthase
MTNSSPKATGSRERLMAREAWIEATTLADLLDREAARNQGEALVFPDQRITFPELAARARHVARALRSLGVGPGDNVGIMLPNSVEYMAVLFGIAKLGAIPVPINLRFKEVELGHVVINADLRVVVTTDRGREFVDFAELLVRALPEVPGQDAVELHLDTAPELRQIVMLGESSPPGFLPAARFDDGADAADPDEIDRLQELVMVSQVAMIMYTSGTTSRPKGAMLTHEGLTRMAALVAATRYELTSSDSFWTPLPMFHIGGMIGMLACISAGCRCCHVGVMDGARALDQIEHERVTVAFPTFEQLWLPVITQPRFPEADLSALRLVQCTGFSPRLLDLHRTYLPHMKQIAASGLTEATSYTSMNRASDDEESRLYTHGRPLPGVELKIVDPATGVELSAGDRGELLVRGFGRFAGYYGDPEATAIAIDDDGWLHTGDLGVIDSQGRHTFVGRIKDMLKVGGENVAAAEIEDHLGTHPAVVLAQVVAAPDARYGEVAAAFVELVPGASVEEDELIAHCVGRIATFKVPRYVRVVTEWPMSGTKIRKTDLRQQIARELEERGITEAPRIDTRRA